MGEGANLIYLPDLWVHDAELVSHQIYGYLPIAAERRRRFGTYKLMLCGDIIMYVYTTCPDSLHDSEQAGVNRPLHLK